MMENSLGQDVNSLTHVRELIGFQQKSSISIGTQTSKVFEVDARNVLIMTTMALAIICNSLRDASYLFATSSINIRNHKDKLELANQAYAFIQGTGLEITIQRFSLDLNANNIRYNFYRIFHVNEES